jgi:hypothetical protein
MGVTLLEVGDRLHPLLKLGILRLNCVLEVYDCYRHNLAKPDGGPRTRWAYKIDTINL